MDGWNAASLRDRPLKGCFLLSGAGVRNVTLIPGIPDHVEPDYKRPGCCCSTSTDTTSLRANKDRIMLASPGPVCGLLLILHLQIFTCFPIMADADVDMLKVRKAGCSGQRSEGS